MGAVAMPEERVPVELVPMQFQHITGIGQVGIADGRVYVTLIEEQPGDRPGCTVPVAIAKLMTDMENVPEMIAQMQAVYDEWARAQRRYRGN